MDRKTNPYADCSLGELWVACQRRAAELMERGVARTPAQREQLAESTAYLLLAAARAVAPAEHRGDAPENELRNGRLRLAEAFAEAAQRESRDVRYRIVMRAADQALAGQGWRWLRSTSLDGREVTAVAMDSDEGLRRVLELLQTERDAR